MQKVRELIDLIHKRLVEEDHISGYPSAWEFDTTVNGEEMFDTVTELVVEAKGQMDLFGSMVDKSGAVAIIEERIRQIEKEGWTPEHDDEHGDGALALAAICYAAPCRVFVMDDRYVNQVTYRDPWPWEAKWDKRYSMGERRGNLGNSLPDGKTLSDDERVNLLIKAGALVAAEIDRIKRNPRAGIWEAQAKAALSNGRKIEAIKIVRGGKGVGLKEAKEMVDAWEATMERK